MKVGYLYIYGTSGHDWIDAPQGMTNGADYVSAGDGDDAIFGLGGDDFLIGGAGGDYIEGGTGRDTVSYRGSDEAVHVSLRQWRGVGGHAEGDSLFLIENVQGSKYSDTLIGNEAANALLGFDGHDTLKGWGGVDYLMGGAGDDLLQGGSDTDTLDGGFGVDTAEYSMSAEGVFVDLRNNVGLWGDAEGDQFLGIENLTGSVHHDDLKGDNGDNVLRGLDGSDQLYGNGGADTLWGGDGHDEIAGGGSVDTLFGELGNDTLWGGYGLDHLYGGLGADTFLWQSIAETAVSTVLADVILDFNAAEGDLIELSGIDADAYAGGNQTFTFIGNAAFSGAPGELRYYHAGAYTFIEMQVGTSADVEGVLRLAGIHVPDASWFTL